MDTLAIRKPSLQPTRLVHRVLDATMACAGVHVVGNTGTICASKGNIQEAARPTLHLMEVSKIISHRYEFIRISLSRSQARESAAILKDRGELK